MHKFNRNIVQNIIRFFWSSILKVKGFPYIVLVSFSFFTLGKVLGNVIRLVFHIKLRYFVFAWYLLLMKCLFFINLTKQPEGEHHNIFVQKYTCLILLTIGNIIKWNQDFILTINTASYVSYKNLFVTM